MTGGKIMKEMLRQRPGKLCRISAALICASVIFSGCKVSKKPDKEPQSAVTETTQTTTASGTIDTQHLDGYEYEVMPPDEYGPDLCRGWYIRDTEDEKYVLICDGWKPDGSYGLKVTGVRNGTSGEGVVISVIATRDPEVVTDVILHPACTVKFNKIPDKIKVLYDDGEELGFGGRITDTKEWALDTVIGDDFFAIFSDRSGGRKTYVYKTSDNRFRYINVLARSDKTYVKGSGSAETINYIDYVARDFGAHDHVTVKGDENNKRNIQQFIDSFCGQKTG